MKRQLYTPLAVALAAFAVFAATASAAIPVNTSQPTISGQLRQGSTLTVSNGSWSNAPLTYKYQWQRCGADGSGCADITGAVLKTYTLTSADVDHTVRAIVTATNADGSAQANSKPTGLISSGNAPTNTSKPTISGSPVVGHELTATTGTWTGGVSSYSFQWQRCQSDGLGCVNITGATSRTDVVRDADVGHRLRVGVTAKNASSSATAYSEETTVVTSTPGTTTTVTQTVPGNKAPGIGFLSLRRSGNRVTARFSICDDHTGRITIIERDNKARALSYTRRFSVILTSSCGRYTRSWIPASRFRTRGRYVVTLRAQDRSGALSRLVSRSLFR